jgi:hypothetical protein
MSDFPEFFGVAPSPQNALDLFKGEWSTRLPDACGLVASTGPMRGCEDYRVNWFEPLVGGYAGKRVLELGPLEGGHAYMLEQKGAASVLSIEANPRSYLKCLVLKEVFRMQRTQFLLGDFLPYLRSTQEHFSVGFACGVLYHLLNPVELIQLLAKTCDSVFVWTHCYDAAFLQTHPELGQYFAPHTETATVGGFTHQLHRKTYANARDWKGFCGGGAGDACWLTRETILAAFQHFGFRVVSSVDEQNPNGPALLLAVTRT